MLKCPRCKRVFNNDVSICSTCGYTDEQLWNKNTNLEFKICPYCKKEYLYSTDHCIECGYSTESYKIKSNKLKKELLNDNITHTSPNTPKCPTCGSTNIKKITTGQKVGGMIGFGIFSKTIKSQFECKSCGYKW